MNNSREQPIVIRRKKVYKHGHHGGAWKVAFADFMTAMMALFLVLWLVTQSSDIKSAIAGYFQDPLGHAGEFGSSMMPGEGAATRIRPISPPEVLDMRMQRLQRLADHLQEQLEESLDFSQIRDHVEIVLTPEGLRITLIEDTTGVFFATGSATPMARGVDLLLMLGAELGGLDHPVVVEGHTDATPFVGRRNYSNWELSADRANAARRILATGGLADARISQIRGLADRELRVPDDPNSPLNRRVTITVEIGDPTIPWPSDTAGLRPSSGPARPGTAPPFFGGSP